MDFMAMVHARMREYADGHLEKVVAVTERAEERRKARNNEKARRAFARKSPEEKLELSRRKKARMRELHGDGYYYEQNRAWRGTEKGRKCVEAYNRSEGHRESERAYRQRKMAEDREGVLRKDRERAAEYRRRRKAWALWVLLTWMGERRI